MVGVHPGAVAVSVWALLFLLAPSACGLIDWKSSQSADPRSWSLDNTERWNWWSGRDREWASVSETLFYSPTRPDAAEIPRIVHQIWLGGPLPTRYQAFSETWSDKNPGWLHRIWLDVDAAGLHMKNRDAFEAATNLGEKSDILRLEILEQFGGVYVDTDFECLSTLEPVRQRRGFFAALSNVGFFEVSNGIIGAAPQHPVISRAMEFVGGERSLEGVGRAASSSWIGMPIIKRTGPGAFTHAVMSHVMEQRTATDVVLYPVGVFFPTPNNLSAPPSDQEMRDKYLRLETRAIHHWAASWL